MIRRDVPALGAPPEPSSLLGFPRWTLAASRVVWRAHHVDRGPWWFTSAGDGRFDLPDPDGTCYLAATPTTALREAMGAKLLRAGVLTPAVLAGRVVSGLHLDQNVRLADTRSPKAVEFGVTREVHTITPYGVPQAWARAFRAARCGGVRYEPRHTTGTRDMSFAVFGLHGRRDWPVDPSPRTAAEVATAAGLQIFPGPRRPATVDAPADVGS